MDSARLIADTTAQLRARGERMTSARRAVLVALAENPGHHSAEVVAGLVASVDPAVHRSSVYRGLETLCSLGVVAHVHVGHGTTVYHLAHAPHLHAQCRRCGTLVDLPATALDTAAAALTSEHGFTLDPTHVALSGTCARCAADVTA